MTIKAWISCIGDTSEMFFSVWDGKWFTTDSKTELIIKFGDSIIKDVSISTGDLDVEICFFISD